VDHAVDEAVLDGVGHGVEELLLEAHVVDGFCRAVSGGEEGTFASEVLVNTARDEGIEELVEPDEVFKVLGAVGERRSSRVLVVDVEVKPEELDGKFLEGSSGGRTDDVSYVFVWFEEELAIGSALRFTIDGIGVIPPRSS
jgi:hypothetical protein